jgi:hypothetical protein
MTPAFAKELDRLGVRALPTPKQPQAPVWMPAYRGEEPPF